MMISYIVGQVAETGNGHFVLQAGAIGYYVSASNATISRLAVGQDAKIHTVLQLKENDISLIGFLASEDVRIFNMLTSVSGVGAKVALAIQDVLDASRIVLELRDKLKSSDSFAHDIVAPQQSLAGGNAEAKADATEALVALGYTKNEALRAIMEVALPEMTTDQIIRQALRKLT